MQPLCVDAESVCKKKMRKSTERMKEILHCYSGTSDKGPSEIGTTSLQGTKLLAPKCPLFGGSTVFPCERFTIGRSECLIQFDSAMYML